MVKSDTVIGIGLILLSVFFFVDSYSITQSTISAPMADAASFPRFVSMLLALASFVLILKDRLRKRKMQEDEKVEEESEEEMSKGKNEVSSEKYVYYMMAATTVYIFLVPLIGYLVSTVAYMVVSCLYLGSAFNKRWKLTVLIAVLISVFAFFLFSIVLSVFLPRGFLI